ncbi:MAG: hypothetical protein ACKVOR_09800 [Flavobacteriales bacterium]
MANPNAANKLTEAAPAIQTDELIGKADDLLPESLAAKKKIIDDVLSGRITLRGNKMKANFGEMVCDYNFLSRQWTLNGRTGTFKRISRETTQTLDDPIRHGIDGVYEFSNPGIPPTPPPKYVVNESKFGGSRLGKEATKSGGSQMMERWIVFNLKKSVDKNLMDDILLHGYDSVVTRVASDGTSSFSKLNSSARVIQEYWP